MKRLLLILLCCSLWAGLAEAATRYVTTVACTNTYQVSDEHLRGGQCHQLLYHHCGCPVVPARPVIPFAFAARPRWRARTRLPLPSSPCPGQTWEGCRTRPVRRMRWRRSTPMGRTHIFYFDNGLDGPATT